MMILGSSLGQFVIAPDAACEIAVQQGTIFSVRILAVHGGNLLGKLADALPSPSMQAVVRDQMQALLALATRAEALPQTAPANSEFSSQDQAVLCRGLRLAWEQSANVSIGAIEDARQTLLETMEKIQAAQFLPEQHTLLVDRRVGVNWWKIGALLSLAAIASAGFYFVWRRK